MPRIPLAALACACVALCHAAPPSAEAAVLSGLPPLFTDVTSTHVPSSAGMTSTDAEFGDFDKDGDLDVVVSVEHGRNRVYLNDGTGKLTEKANALGSATNDNEDIAVGDFDKDGNLDIIIITEGGGEQPQYFLGNGDGTFQNVSSRLTWKCSANGVEAADVNADGWLDFMVGCGGQDLLLINNKQGGFVNETSQRLPGNLGESTQDVKFGDLDGDGDPDIVVGNESGKNRLLINDGTGRFADSAQNLPIPYAEETREVLLLDVDKDGDLDIVFCNITCNNCGQRVKDPQVRLLINNGKGKFTDETRTRLPVNTFSSWDGGYLDFDADGDLDLIICAIDVPGFTPRGWRAWRNDGTGRFTDATSEVMPPATVGRGWDVEVGDLNKDGALDMYLAAFNTQNRLVLGTVKQPTTLKRKGGVRMQGRTRLVLSASRPGTWAFLPMVEAPNREGYLDAMGRGFP